MECLLKNVELKNANATKTLKKCGIKNAKFGKFAFFHYAFFSFALVSSALLSALKVYLLYIKFEKARKYTVYKNWKLP